MEEGRDREIQRDRFRQTSIDRQTNRQNISAGVAGGQTRGPGVTGGCKPPVLCLEPNLGLLPVQCTPVATSAHP